MQRRDLLKAAGAGALLGGVLPAAAQAPCPGAGTPVQFMPQTPLDPTPLTDELGKYPKCPYCGMSRQQWQHSRHLVHYSDDLVDGTCSLHCAAVSLSLNLDRAPKAIYAADFGAQADIKPLVEVGSVTYLIGSTLPATMSRRSKMAFAEREDAEAAQAQVGGELGDFDAALTAAYLDMAEDTIMIRQRREERRRRKEQARQAQQQP